jgi:hypothetical protein
MLHAPMKIRFFRAFIVAPPGNSSPRGASKVMAARIRRSRAAMIGTAVKAIDQKLLQ